VSLILGVPVLSSGRRQKRRALCEEAPSVAWCSQYRNGRNRTSALRFARIGLGRPPSRYATQSTSDSPSFRTWQRVISLACSLPRTLLSSTGLEKKARDPTCEQGHVEGLPGCDRPAEHILPARLRTVCGRSIGNRGRGRQSALV